MKSDYNALFFPFSVSEDSGVGMRRSISLSDLSPSSMLNSPNNQKKMGGKFRFLVLVLFLNYEIFPIFHIFCSQINTSRNIKK